MSEIVNVIPNLKSSLKIQVRPEVLHLSEELLRTEKSSFNTKYLQRVKSNLNTVMLFNDLMTETILGSEEHNSFSAKAILNSVRNRFGFSDVSSTQVKTYEIDEIPALPEPTYEGPNSTLISVTEVYTGENDPHYVDLVWLTDPLFVSYRIMRNGIPIATIPNGSTSTYSDHTVSRGVNYTYAIETTVETFGVIPLSNSISVSTTPPISIDAPVITATVEGQNVRIQWNDIPNAASYSVYRNDILVNSPASGDIEWLDTSAPVNQNLTYYMIANHAEGLQSSRSNEEEVYVSYQQPIYIPIIQSVEVQGAKIRVTWNNNGNLQNVNFNIYMNDSLEVSEISGSRTSVEEGNWNAFYDVTVPNVIDPYEFYVTTVFDGRESERSDILGINQLEDPADIKLWVNGIASTNWPTNGLEFPIDSELEITTEYGVANSEITTGSIVATATGFVAPAVDYGVTVTSVNNFSMTDTMVASSGPITPPGWLSITVTYIGSHQQIVATNTYVLEIAAAQVLPDLYNPYEISAGDRSAQVWGTGAHKEFNTGDQIRIDTQEFTVQSQGAVAINKIDLTFTQAYIGVNPILAGSTVTNLTGGGSGNTEILTANPVSSGMRAFDVNYDQALVNITAGDTFVFEGYEENVFTVSRVLLGSTEFTSTLMCVETYFGTTIPINTRILLT
jgi:hypothetical protein